MIQRPIFILSGKLVHSLGLNQARPLAAGEAAFLKQSMS